MRYFNLVCVIVTTLFITSCGSSRQSASQSTTVKTGSVEQKFDTMVASYGEWDKVSFPMKAEIKSPINFSLSGRTYMVNDEQVHMSLKMFGMEVALLHIDTDSIYLVDKFHKIAVIEALPVVEGNNRVTVGDIQSLLLGRVIVPGGEKNISSRSKYIKFETPSTPETKEWSFVEYWGKGDNCKCTFNVEDAISNIVSIVLNMGDRSPMKCVYSDWTECEIGQMPKRVAADVALSDKTVSAAIVYTPGSLTKGDKVNVPAFKRPDRGYRIIPASDLVATLKNIL